MMWNNGSWGSAGMGAGAVLMLIFWLMALTGTVLLIVWAVRQFSHAPYHGGGPSAGGHYETWREQPYVGQRGVERGGESAAAARRDMAIDTARERYARGEIDREELERILATLREIR